VVHLPVTHLGALFQDPVMCGREVTQAWFILLVDERGGVQVKL